MNELTELIPEVSAIVAAVGGGGLASGMARLFIRRSITQLELIPERLSEIKTELEVIKHKVSSVEGLRGELREQEKRINQMEVRIEHAKRRSYSDDQERSSKSRSRS